MFDDKKNRDLHDSRIKVTLFSDILPKQPNRNQFSDCDGDCDLPLDCDCDCACSDKFAKPVSLSEPISYYLELTPHCPNRCYGCGNVFADQRTSNHLQKTMSFEHWKVILEKISISASFLRITGGEPTLHPSFFDIIRIIDDLKIPFALLTTGRWGNKRKILQALSQNQSFQGFLISLHGPTSKVHEAFTGSVGSFNDAVDSIQMAVEMGFKVAVSTVMLGSNLQVFEETVRKAVSLGANHVVFGRYIGDDIPGLTLSASKIHEAISEVARLEAEGYPVRFGNCIPQCFEPSTSLGCTAGRTFCTIDPWGNVRPCNHAKVVVGNLLNTAVDSIWNSKKMLDWREAYNEACLSCAAFGQCRGGCKALYFDQAHRDPLMHVPFNQFTPVTTAHEIQLQSSSIPKREFVVREEIAGDFLVARGRAVNVTSDQLSFLNCVVDNYALKDIQGEFGDEALSYLGKLYLEGYISF